MQNNNLIVVYKDELIVNELRKLVENHNRMKRSPGGDISITLWSEKAWKQGKKSEDTDSKVLFIGDIAGTKNLIPLLDIKFNNFGVKYGWAGNRAVLVADVKALKSMKDYTKFCEELQKELTVEEYRKNVPVEWLNEISENLETKLVFPSIYFYKFTKGFWENFEKIKRQQYLYGIDVFYKRDFEDFMEI